jgi:hypothetical protein
MDAVSRKLRQQPAFAEGRREAEAAIAGGALEYRINGKLDSATCEQAAALLKDRFGIHLRLYGHCIVQNAALDEGFNERMAEEFLHRFDRDVVKEVFREVERKRKGTSASDGRFAR